ncbi:uncharacterized protein LOC131888474 [Tigriopus californicus]|nr:uncharacterized protein LOC131888474 [Tigriopus californicus]
MRLDIGLVLIVASLALLEVLPVLGNRINEPLKGSRSIEEAVNATASNRRAFRDVLLENTTRRVFDNLMDQARQGKMEIFPDPIGLADIVNLHESSSLFDISLSATRINAYGLRNLQLTYLRVIRHFGLKDIKVFVRVQTNLVLRGRYNVTGSALFVIPVDGAGNFTITIGGLTASSVLCLTVGKDSTRDGKEFTVKDLELSLSHESISFDFENLMGGGAWGSAANSVVNSMGEVIMDNQRKALTSVLKRDFRQLINTFL